MDDYARAKIAFQRQGQVVIALLETLSPEDWYKPTRLSGWNVLTLVAHLREVGAGFDTSTTTVLKEPPTQDRVSYWHFTGSEVAPFIDQNSKEAASKLTPDKALDEFKRNIEATIIALEQLSDTTVVKLLFGSITLAELVVARIVELSIHSLDLAQAIGQVASLDIDAQLFTVNVLEALLQRPRPLALADDLDFIEAASGRKPYPGLQIPAFS